MYSHIFCHGRAQLRLLVSGGGKKSTPVEKIWTESKSLATYSNALQL